MGASESPPPQGYLGSTGRIASGPAPELVEAGYEVELADVELLQPGLTLADIAHVLELDALSLIPASERDRLLGGLQWLADADADELRAEARYGDVYNVRERLLEQRIGPAAGWLAAGRTRREAGRIAFRIALRGRLLGLGDALGRFVEALVERSGEHVDAIMADYTYLQPAQPSTFGHYLLSFAYPALRDLERLRRCYAWVNECPAGVGGVCGTRLNLDRERLARSLGFDRPATHTRDAMWEADGLVDVLVCAAAGGTIASRLAEDLEVYGSDEFGLVRVADEYCRASVLMPQKRNPYALAVIRGAAGLLAGKTTAVSAMQRTPSARTDNWLFAYGETASGVDVAARTLQLSAGVVETLVTDRRHMRAQLEASFASAADLSEVLMLHTDLDYRTCYRIVGRAVAEAVAQPTGVAALDGAAVERAAQALTGSGLGVSEEVIADALDPATAVASRGATGGAAPEPMGRMLDECREQLGALRRWAGVERARAVAAESALRDRAHPGALDDG